MQRPTRSRNDPYQVNFLDARKGKLFLSRRRWFVNRMNMAHFYAVRFDDLPRDARTGGPDIRHAQRMQTANAHLVSGDGVFRTAGGVPIPQWKCSLCDWRTRRQRTSHRLWNALQEFIRHLETKH